MWPADRPDLRARVVWATVLLVVAKLTLVVVPYFFKWATDALAGDVKAPPPLPAFLLAPVMLVDRLQCRPHRAGRLQPAARRAVCARRPVCGAPACLPHLRAPARTVAALPSRAAHRRPVAHHRARHQGHRDDRPLHHADDGADHPRIRADGGDLRLRLWLDLCRGGRGHRLALHLVHRAGRATGASRSAAR